MRHEVQSSLFSAVLFSGSDRVLTRDGWGSLSLSHAQTQHLQKHFLFSFFAFHLGNFMKKMKWELSCFKSQSEVFKAMLRLLTNGGRRGLGHHQRQIYVIHLQIKIVKASQCPALEQITSDHLLHSVLFLPESTSVSSLCRIC